MDSLPPSSNTPPTPPPAANQYEAERRQKLDKLRSLGIDPFGQRVEGISPLTAAKASYAAEMGHDGGPILTVAGRIMLKRDMGKLSFITLRDESGDLQVGLDKKRLTDPDWEVRNLLDLGDQIVITGNLGVTNKGEVTVWASNVQMAAKSLHTPPGKYEGLENVEQRYRERYVDLFTNPEVMRQLTLRARLVQEIRGFMQNRGYLEVETPMMQPLHGGANARPFVTHHNALDIPLYMRVAPELYLKRLLVGGYRKVFELNRNFRNEGISPRHNPEFTMLEAYEAYGNWETCAELVESMVCHLAETIIGTLHIQHKDAEGNVVRSINLQRPWRRVTMVDLVAEKTGWHFDGTAIPDAVLDTLRTAGARVEAVKAMTPHEQLVHTYEKLIEHDLIDPCFVTQVPSVMIPLAKEHPTNKGFADVYELAINGQEISPGYTELNDPDVQAAHFMHQVGDEAEKQKIDHDFLNALKYGMPPAGGFGLGIDRLVMLLTGAQSIRDVILFPLMKPQA